MIINDFTAAMSTQEFLDGEALHKRAELSRMLAMSAGLTKSSEELEEAYKKDPELYLLALKGAIAAHEDCKNIEDLIVGCLARLVSVVDDGDDGDDAADRAMEIVRESNAS